MMFENDFPDKVVKYKCYTATYFIVSHNFFIWQTDYKTDNAILVVYIELKKEPTEKEMIRHIKNYITNQRRRKR